MRLTISQVITAPRLRHTHFSFFNTNLILRNVRTHTHLSYGRVNLIHQFHNSGYFEDVRKDQRWVSMSVCMDKFDASS